MTDRAEIERLLNKTGRTLEGLPTEMEYMDSPIYGVRCEEMDKELYAGGFEATYPSMLHQSDVIELLIAALKDSEPVVRCKDCKHWGTDWALGETEHVKCCEFANYMVGANGYCVYGEVKSNESE